MNTTSRKKKKAVSVDIIAVLAAPLSAAALAAAQRSQTFNVRIADRALRVEGDPVRLAQAVSNLLYNAVKYTPELGCITVNVLADHNVLVVSVKDDGLGTLLPHILEYSYFPCIFWRFARKITFRSTS